MAFSTLTKATCATCGSKGVGIFKCEGCSQIFCRKHVNEHRENLSHQLDEIVLEHDTLQQTIAEQNDQQNHRHVLLKQINKWEKDSIMKVQQAAKEARQQVEELTSLQKGEVSKNLSVLAERLRQARTDDDYVETDLHAWTIILKKLKNDIVNISRLITIGEDSTKLIGKINVTGPMQHVKQEERFGESSGDVRIEGNGQVMTHGDLERSDVFVRGTSEYSLGKYKIRFFVKRKQVTYHLSFGIMSKVKSIPQSEDDMKTSTYGWRSSDIMIPLSADLQTNKDFQDMRGRKTFAIELLLDCDNRKISYFNQQTNRMREMNVDITICPLPWQLLFYLYDVDDSIQLISSSQQ